MQQQQLVQGEKNIEKDIKTIFDNFEYIKDNTKNEFPLIPKGSQVLIFLGEFGQNFHTFYQHFQIQQVILDTKQYKLIRIEKQGKFGYLLHFPLILQYDDQNIEISLNLCISKIFAEKALKKMDNCKYYLVVDINQLNGEDEKAKINTIICDSVFYFGKYYFKENQFLCLQSLNEDQWNLFTIKKLKNNKQELELEFDFIEVKSNQVLKSIFNFNYLSQVKINSNDILNYGKMISYIQKQQDFLTQQLNDLLQNFQEQLLMLQQMPLIQSKDDTKQKVGNYIKELQQGFIQKEDPLTHSFCHISKVLTFLNKVNKGMNAIELNKIIQENNGSQIQQFFQDNNIQTISIQPFFNDVVSQNLNQIMDFLNIYHKTFFQNLLIVEVEKLQINLSFWCQYFDEDIEYTLYELNYLVKRIQEGPKNEIENGVYFIGVTKSGKSTTINAILNPDKLIMKKVLGLQSYVSEQEFQTKFKIGQGSISETQKIIGLYNGKKEELDKIFYNQENNQDISKNEKDVFSQEELLNMGLINQLNIPDNWFIFDCPGFDHNSNQLMAIAHRISLYNYFKKTKNIIIYFVLDISKLDITIIKNTFDPISCLLKNQNDLQKNFKDWTNLILTKGENDSRLDYLKDWDLAYKGQLEQNYGYYKQLFADDERCLEFLKPSQAINEDINKISNKIIQTTIKQLQLKKHNPSFELLFDDKVWNLFEKCIPKIKMKLEQLFKLFLQDLDQYFLRSNDTLDQKKEQLQKLQNCLLHQQTNQMISVIDQNNCNYILQNLSQWINGNQYTQKMFFFVKAYIQDIETIFKISEHCKNKQIVPFDVKIDNLVNKVQNILQIIELIKIYFTKLGQIFDITLFINSLPSKHILDLIIKKIGSKYLLNFLTKDFKLKMKQILYYKQSKEHLENEQEQLE